jgi:hypothetical protein
MIKLMKPHILLLVFITGFCLTAQANSVRIFSLNAEDWARPRAGEVIPQLESARLAINYWDSLDGAAIVLSHPGEDSGELWASELRDWMISLGIPSDHIALSPGLQSSAELRIFVGYPAEVPR